MRYLTVTVSVASVAILIASLQAGDPPAQAAREAFFESKIRPLLIEKCYGCHSIEKGKSKGELTLDTPEGWKKGGEHGPALVPGQPEKSLLIQAVRYADAELKMPPAKNGGKLSDKEIALLEQWVRDGAEIPKPVQAAAKSVTSNWWAFQPLKDVKVPSEKLHPVDGFINARLAEKGLKALPAADKRTLLRRVTYDLTGLPPTVEDTNTFLGDLSPQAWAKVIDRLLSSPQYGVRWGRHWLDVVRYADSLDERGYDKEGDILDAWRYRDWVVNAFNSDLPYDQFITHQLAGDILAAQPGQWSRDKIIATGMYAIGNWGNGDADKEKLHTDIVDDQVDVTSRAFLGLTVACARCHDHKFDPISTQDYYALSGFFFSSHILDKFQAKGAGEMLMRIPLRSPEEKKRLEAVQKRVQAIDQQLSQSLRPFTETQENIAGIPGVRGATAMGANNPSLTVNTTDKAVAFATIKLRPHAIAVHPGPQIPVSLVWKSPFACKITIHAKLHDADPNCGNGIDWHLKHGSKVLHEGVMDNGKSVTAPVTMATVQKDDLIILTVGPRGEYSCDTTEVIFNIVLEKGEEYSLRQTLQREKLPGKSSPWSVCSGSGSKLVDDDSAMVKLMAERAELLKSLGEPEFAQGLLEGGIVDTTYAGYHDARVHKRGSYNRLGDLVPRGFPTAVAKGQPKSIQGSGRLELAQWIASPANPLTARLMVNRLWQHHFTEGLVRTSNNFGKLGSVPTHPELLDYLAREFINKGWSVKAMHRLILTSQAYQRSSIVNQEHQALVQADPENLLLARQHRRRLSAEELRDSLLAVTGELDTNLGGKSIRDLASKRRTIYVTTIRSDRTTFQFQFDAADPNAIVEKRTEATVAPQSLWLLNHPFVMERAKVLAGLVAKQPGNSVEKMHWLAERLFTRRATAKELELVKRIITNEKQADEWEMLCQVLFCSNEMFYLD